MLIDKKKLMRPRAVHFNGQPSHIKMTILNMTGGHGGKWCYTPLQHDVALDPIIPPFDFHFRIYKRDLAILITN